jgi:uncharacterized membrane-anchored protein YitT (DUF2179 family)
MYVIKHLSIIIVSSIILAFSFNMFLLPHEVLSSGVTGIAFIIGLKMPWVNSGMMILLLNIPIVIYGYKVLGKRLILYTVISIAVTSLSMQIIPKQAIAQDPLLSAVFGGAIVGFAVGLVFKNQGSTGGFDIIGLGITRKKEIPLGTIMFILNAAVVFVAGFLFDWDRALFTMASIFVTGKVIDAIHTSHLKLTVTIITSKGQEMKKELLENVVRGITVWSGEGAYSEQERKILYTVVSRYELGALKEVVTRIDDKAFVNITSTIDVIGNFRRI